MAALSPRAFPYPWDDAIQETRSTRSKKEKGRKEFGIFGNSSESESFALNVFLHVFHKREINTEPFVFSLSFQKEVGHRMWFLHSTVS